MKLKRILICLIVLGVIMFPGCTDKLGTVDFSGHIDLIRSSDGWAYKNIASSKVNPLNVDPEDRLGNYQKDLELQKALTIGKGEYMIATKFKTDRPSTGFDFLDILLKTDRFTVFGDYQIVIYNFDIKERVETVAAKDSESGDPWDSKIDDLKRNHKNRSLERQGEFVHYFREPSVQKDCVIEVFYEIKSDLTRKVDEEGNFLYEEDYKKSYQYDNLSVNGSARINVGFRQCLAGERTIGKQTIKFYVLDWNLDGDFTEDDVVWSDHTNKTYPFSEKIRLTNSWSAKKDNTYLLKLIKPKFDGEKYELRIELVKKGKR